MKKIKLACVNTLIPDVSLIRAGELLNGWGIEGMSIYSTDEGCTDEFVDDMKKVAETGTVPCEFAYIDEAFGNLVSDDINKKQQNIALVKKAIDICGTIGALTEIEYECGHRADMPSYNNNNYPLPPAHKQDEFVDVIRELAGYAKDRGVMVLLEAVNRYEASYVNTQAHALEFIRKAGCENTGLLSDLFHMSLDEENLASVIRECGRYVKHVHIGDTNRHLPGKGYMDWPSIIRALKEIDFDGYMSFECTVMGDPIKEIPEAASYIRKLIETI